MISRALWGIRAWTAATMDASHAANADLLNVVARPFPRTGFGRYEVPQIYQKSYTIITRGNLSLVRVFEVPCVLYI